MRHSFQLPASPGPGWLHTGPRPGCFGEGIRRAGKEDLLLQGERRVRGEGEGGGALELKPGGVDGSVLTTGLVGDEEPTDFTARRLRAPLSSLLSRLRLTIGSSLRQPVWRCKWLPFLPQLCSGAVS